MIDAEIERVRSFNRTVTQRIGVLQDEYLARGRPLGASRVLWEVGEGPVDVRALRARLDLDSGYLSRLLRSLEALGLTVGSTIAITVSGIELDGVAVELPEGTAEVVWLSV